MKTDEAHHYIKSLRNTSKRAYADHYWSWLVGTIVGTTDRPEPDHKDANLSYMAGQAVRMRLREFTT